MMHSGTPAEPYSLRARQSAALISVLALVSIAILPVVGEGGFLANLGGLLRFFTIWSNLAAAVIFAIIAIRRPVSRGIMAALATALTVVGSIYWTLLSGDHQPVGIERITNQVHHTIVPIAGVVWWVMFTPKAPANLALVPAIMVPPLSYGAFAFVLGELTGFYAYFFVDLPALGWTKFIISNVALALFFALLGLGLLTIKNAINRVL